MLGWITVASVGCAVLFSAPVQLAVATIAFLITLMPVALSIALIYGRGYVRTFAIGAAFPGVPLPVYAYLLLERVSVGSDVLQTRLAPALLFCVPLVILGLYGGVAMVVRWLIGRLQGPTLETALEIPHSESPFDRKAGTD